MARLQEIKRKTGKSAYFLVIPLNYVKGFNWRKGTNLEFEIMGKDKLKIERKKQGSVK